MNLTDIYIKHIIAVNNSKTVEEHASNKLYLRGWNDGVIASGKCINYLDADRFYLSQDIHRPMCCGEWLDWKEEGKE